MSIALPHLRANRIGSGQASSTNIRGSTGRRAQMYPPLREPTVAAAGRSAAIGGPPQAPAIASRVGRVGRTQGARLSCFALGER